MEKNQPVNVYDFAHLETFLDMAHARLTKGFAVDGNYDEYSALNADSFFSGVSDSSRVKEFKSDPHYIDYVCDVLNKFMPKMFSALETRGDDLDKAELFKSWTGFMAKENASAQHRLDVITTQGSHLIYHAASRKQIPVAFKLLDAALEELEGMQASSPDQLAVQHDFIEANSLETIYAYATQTENGLKPVNQSALQKDETLYEYKSYAAEAIKLYQKSLGIMGRVGSPHQQFAYAMKGLPLMRDAVAHAEAGTCYIKNEMFLKTLKPDFKLQVTTLEASLKAMAASGKYHRTFQEQVVEHVPDMMDDLIRHHHGSLCCSLFNKTIDVLDRYPEQSKEFAAAFGARAAVSLLKNNSGYSGDIMLSLRHTLDLDKSDVLFLMDPSKDEKARPVAALININLNKNVDNDILLTFRENRPSVPFVRDNLSPHTNRKDVFLPGLWHGNAGIDELSRRLSRLIMRTDDPVHEPEVEKQSALLYSCRQYDLLLKG